jgi:hypothetical protein
MLQNDGILHSQNGFKIHLEGWMTNTSSLGTIGRHFQLSVVSTGSMVIVLQIFLIYG